LGGNGCAPGEDPPFTMPGVYRIPSGLVQAGTPFLVALRTDGTLASWIGAARMRDPGPYVLSDPANATLRADLAQLAKVRATIPTILFAWTNLGLSVLLLGLWAANRGRQELLWFGLFEAAIAVFNGSSAFLIHHGGHLPTVFNWALPLGYTFLNYYAYTALN